MTYSLIVDDAELEFASTTGLEQLRQAMLAHDDDLPVLAQLLEDGETDDVPQLRENLESLATTASTTVKASIELMLETIDAAGEDAEEAAISDGLEYEEDDE